MKTILIYVWDDSHILQQLQQLVKTILLELRLYHVEVITSTSSSNANEIMQCSQVDLLLLEDTDRAQSFLEFVRSFPNKPATVLMTKKSALVAESEMTAKSDIAEILERPIERNKLKGLLKKFLSKDGRD